MLAKTQGLDTALFDLDSYFGAAALTLDIEAGRGLRDALEKPERVDGLFLERVMAKPFAGLSVLSGEEPLQEILHPHPTAGETILAALRHRFQAVVVDLPRQMNPLTRHVLAHADHVIIVAEPQLGPLRDALRLKDYVVDGLQRPAPLLLLNRVGMVAKHELAVKDFAKHYGSAPALQLPYLPEMVAAGADGKLPIANAKLAAALSPLAELLQTLTGAAKLETEAAKPGSLFAKFKAKERRA
jgi:pilus assembly protein CpaE